MRQIFLKYKSDIAVNQNYKQLCLDQNNLYSRFIEVKRKATIPTNGK